MHQGKQVKCQPTGYDHTTKQARPENKNRNTVKQNNYAVPHMVIHMTQHGQKGSIRAEEEHVTVARRTK